MGFGFRFVWFLGGFGVWVLFGFWVRSFLGFLDLVFAGHLGFFWMDFWWLVSRLVEKMLRFSVCLLMFATGFVFFLCFLVLFVMFFWWVPLIIGGYRRGNKWLASYLRLCHLKTETS